MCNGVSGCKYTNKFSYLQNYKALFSARNVVFICEQISTFEKREIEFLGRKM